MERDSARTASRRLTKFFRNASRNTTPPAPSSVAASIGDGPRRTIRVHTEVLMPSPGGQVSGMTGRRRRGRWQGYATECGIPSTSQRATTRRHGGRADRVKLRAVEGCPRAAVWSGYARSTGCRTVPGCEASASDYRSAGQEAAQRHQPGQHTDLRLAMPSHGPLTSTLTTTRCRCVGRARTTPDP